MNSQSEAAVEDLVYIAHAVAEEMRTALDSIRWMNKEAASRVVPSLMEMQQTVNLSWDPYSCDP